MNEQLKKMKWIPAAAKLPGKTEMTVLKALVYLQKQSWIYCSITCNFQPILSNCTYIKYTIHNLNSFMTKQEEDATLLWNSMAYKYI